MGSDQTMLHSRLKVGELDIESLSEEDEYILNYSVGLDPKVFILIYLNDFIFEIFSFFSFLKFNRSIILNHGDLLIMGGDIQKDWRHRVVKEKNKEVGGRICLTFRQTFKDLKNETKEEEEKMN